MPEWSRIRLTPQKIKDQNRAQFDFIIGSTHYLSDKMDGKKEAVDGSEGYADPLCQRGV